MYIHFILHLTTLIIVVTTLITTDHHLHNHCYITILNHYYTNDMYSLWGALKKMSQRPRNKNHYLYVRSIGLGCWGTCLTVTQGIEWLSCKIPGAALWTSFSRTAWHRCLRGIFSPQSLFYRTKNGVITGREVWTVWRVTENLPHEFLQVCRDCVGHMRPCIVMWNRMTTWVNLPGHFNLISWRRVVKVCE